VTFAYRDQDDQIPAQAIRRNPGTTDAEWLASDVQLIERAAALHAAAINQALDVGSGRGRLIPAIASVSRKVVAVEPDATRAKEAALVAAQIAVPVTVEVCGISSFKAPWPFDLIVCAHVLQHLEPPQRVEAVDALRCLATRDATLLIMYVSAMAPDGRLFESTSSPGGLVVTVERRASAWIDGGGLLTWHAGYGQMEGMLRAAGFTPLDSGVYRRFHHQVTGLDGATELVPAADAYIAATTQ
jgi:SAM-dependent methyltransferase